MDQLLSMLAVVDCCSELLASGLLVIVWCCLMLVTLTIMYLGEWLLMLKVHWRNSHRLRLSACSVLPHHHIRKAQYSCLPLFSDPSCEKKGSNEGPVARPSCEDAIKM